MGPDDCEAAALWLVCEAAARFGTERFFIGGESAGAHLAVVTLLRLRDRHGLSPFSGANLTAGCYDLRLTPSAANWGTDKLVLHTRDIRNFAAAFVQDSAPLTDPDISPIFADLSGMPPAFFTVGTKDPLLDDSLFMTQKWASAGNASELAVYPHGAHVFTSFPSRMTDEAHARIDTFMNTL